MTIQNAEKGGDVRFATFPYNFSIHEVQGSEFWLSMSYHIRQQMVHGFFPTRSHFPGKQINWILLFSQNGRSSKHIKNMLELKE